MHFNLFSPLKNFLDLKHQKQVYIQRNFFFLRVYIYIYIKNLKEHNLILIFINLKIEN